MTAQLDVPFINVSVKLENLEENLLEIVRSMFPGARREDWSFEELRGGYINSIYKLTDLRAKEKKSLVFRTFDVKFDSAGFLKLYTRTEKAKVENGTVKAANGLDLSNGHAKANGKVANGEVRNGETRSAEGTNGEVGNGKAANEKDANEEAKSMESTNTETKQADPPFPIFSRLREYEIMNEVSRYGLCQPVYAKYQNGICYGFTEGTTVNGALMLSDDYLDEAASKFARFHSIKYEFPDLPYKARHERVSDEMREILYENLEKIGEQLLARDPESLYLKMPCIKTLTEHEKRINNTLKQFGFGRIVLCHNDLNQKNLIWNAQKAPGQRLGFIDMELVSPNYAIFDIAYNMGCFPGHLLVDFEEKYYPSSDYRRRFLERYLREFNKIEGIELSDEEFTAELDDLFHRVSLATIAHVLRWCIYSQVFDADEDLLKNEESIAARQKDKLFCAKYALRLYQTFSKLYPQTLADAEHHFAKKQAQNQ